MLIEIVLTDNYIKQNAKIQHNIENCVVPAAQYFGFEKG